MPIYVSGCDSGGSIRCFQESCKTHVRSSVEFQPKRMLKSLSRLIMKYSGPLIVTLLVGIYIALQLIADITAAKIVMLGSTALPAGTFVFALTFTWRDMLHKKLGKEWAQAAIWTAALANVGMALYFVFAIRLNPAPFWQNQEAFSTILGIVPRITIASINAELVSELIDTEVYAQLEHRIYENNQK